MIIIMPAEPSFRQSFQQCTQLQKQLKDEYFLLKTEQDQKLNFEKKLKNSLNSYYRNIIVSDRFPQQHNNTVKRLFQDEGFGDCYIFIKEIILTFSRNPDLCLLLIAKHNNSQNLQSFDGVINVIVGSMFENIVDNHLANKDIFRLLQGLFSQFVQLKSCHTEYQFHESDLITKVIRSFMGKRQFRHYASSVVKSTLLQIAKVDHLINFKKDDDDTKSCTVSLRRVENSSKKISVHKSINSTQKPTNKVIDYCQALKLKDSKLRMGIYSKRTRNRQCASTDLLRFMGIIDHIDFPTFSHSNLQSDSKQQQRINQQWNMVLTRRDSDNPSSSDISLLTNLLFIFFGDLFKMLYSMPLIIRIACRLLYNKLMEKYSNNNHCLSVIGDFVIGYWVVELIEFDDQLFKTSKMLDFSDENTAIVRRVINAILRNEISLIQPAFHCQFNLIVSNLRVNVFNYLTEIINVELPQISSVNSDSIKNHSVCLSVADVDRFIKMIENAEKQVSIMDQKLVSKVKRVRMMSQDSAIFDSRTDHTGKSYKSDQSYVLFSELIYPPDLSFDYMKYYSDAFKKQKIKNVLRQVLLNIGDLVEYYEFPNDCRNLREFFTHILRTRQERLNLNVVDHIPAELKIRYLLAITKIVPIEGYLAVMTQEVSIRLQFLKNLWDRTKSCYLKAISSVLTQNDKISKNQLSTSDEQKLQKIEQFLANAKADACLTSPKTREKETVLRTNMMKQLSQVERQQMWLDSQSKCIHTALNLEFIKSLTGEPQNTRNKNSSHFATPKQFPEMFCALPEVKENGMKGSDSLGIKQVLAEFIEYCVDMVKKDPDYEILAEDVSWLEDTLERKFSKKIYDKLYPLYPTYQDLALFLRLKTLDWVGFQELNIEPVLRVQGMWEVAAKNLKQVEKMKTPSQKLDCILESSKVITRSIGLVKDQGSAVTAEDINEIVIYVLIKAAPRKLVSNVNFIEMYSSRKKLMSRDGYFFSQLKSAIMFCTDLNHESIGMDMVQFNRKIYEKEVEYGIYFMMGRTINSPRTALKKIQYLKQNYFRKDVKSSKQKHKETDDKQRESKHNEQSQ